MLKLHLSKLNPFNFIKSLILLKLFNPFIILFDIYLLKILLNLSVSISFLFLFSIFSIFNDFSDNLPIPASFKFFS